MTERLEKPTYCLLTLGSHLSLKLWAGRCLVCEPAKAKP